MHVCDSSHLLMRESGGKSIISPRLEPHPSSSRRYIATLTWLILAR